jgi:hypothetical protein
MRRLFLLLCLASAGCNAPVAAFMDTCFPSRAKSRAPEDPPPGGPGVDVRPNPAPDPSRPAPKADPDPGPLPPPDLRPGP